LGVKKVQTPRWDADKKEEQKSETKNNDDRFATGKTFYG